MNPLYWDYRPSMRVIALPTLKTYWSHNPSAADAKEAIKFPMEQRGLGVKDLVPIISPANRV